MATLYITEYAQSGINTLAAMPELANQTVAIGGASAQSAAFGSTTNLVRIHTDAICSILMGVNPTAIATKNRMAGNQTEYFTVIGGQKLAVITNS